MATPYLNEVIANFVLLMVALPLCGVVMLSIKEHNEVIVDKDENESQVEIGEKTSDDGKVGRDEFTAPTL